MRPTALIRRPGPRLVDGLVTHIERVPVDPALALRQWEGYGAALESAGWDLVEVPPADDCPDAVFVEDTVVMYRNVGVIARPGADERKPEILDTEKVLESLGCSMNRIHAPGTLDGGDVLKVGDTVYVGRGGRTNAQGVRAAAGDPRAARGDGDHRPGAEGAPPQVRGDRPAGRLGHRLSARSSTTPRSSTGSGRCPRSPAPTSCCSATASC